MIQVLVTHTAPTGGCPLLPASGWGPPAEAGVLCPLCTYAGPSHSHLRTSSGCVCFRLPSLHSAACPSGQHTHRHASSLSDPCLGSLPSSPHPGPCPCRGLVPHVREHVRRGREGERVSE